MITLGMSFIKQAKNKVIFYTHNFKYMVIQLSFRL